MSKEVYMNELQMKLSVFSEDIKNEIIYVGKAKALKNRVSSYFGSQNNHTQKVRKMVEQKKELGWEFLFIGANIDSVETARNYGIDADRAVNYRADSRGTAVMFCTVEKAVGKVRKAKNLDACWSEEIAEDYESRK